MGIIAIYTVRYSGLNTLWNNLTDIFVVAPNVWFLPRSHWVAEKYSRALRTIDCEFKYFRSFKFSTVVRKNNGKQTLENFLTQFIAEIVKSLLHTLLRRTANKKCEQNVVLDEIHCVKAFSLFAPSFNGVHFHNIKVRISLNKFFEILISTTLTILARCKLSAFFPSLFITNLMRQINVSHIENALVYVIVERSSRNANFTGMVGIDVVQRLSIENKRGDQIV